MYTFIDRSGRREVDNAAFGKLDYVSAYAAVLQSFPRRLDGEEWQVAVKLSDGVRKLLVGRIFTSVAMLMSDGFDYPVTW